MSGRNTPSGYSAVRCGIHVFLGENGVIMNNQCQIWVCRPEISYERGITHAYHLRIKQTLFPKWRPGCRWRPYLMTSLLRSSQKATKASRCFFMFRGLITQFKWETSPTPNCKRVYKPSPGLICLCQHSTMLHCHCNTHTASKGIL